MASRPMVLALAVTAFLVSCNGATTPGGSTDDEPGAPYGVACRVSYRPSVRGSDFQHEVLQLRTDDPTEASLAIGGIDLKARVVPSPEDPKVVVLRIDERITSTTQEYRLLRDRPPVGITGGFGFTGLRYLYPPGSDAEAQLVCEERVSGSRLQGRAPGGFDVT